jgi:hypothetical protein
MGTFVLAAALGVLTNRPVWLKGPTAQSLFGIARTHWDDDSAAAELRIFTTRVKMLRRYRETNRWQARLLTAAVGCEVLAILLMAVAVGLIVNHG